MILNIGDRFAGYPTTATNTKAPYVMFPKDAVRSPDGAGEADVASTARCACEPSTSPRIVRLHSRLPSVYPQSD